FLQHLIPFRFFLLRRPALSTLFPYTTLFRSGPGPFRDRLRALHVLRDLRGGVPLRRAVLEPGVRVRRVRHPRDAPRTRAPRGMRSEEHTSELQSRVDLVCRLLLEKKK